MCPLLLTLDLEVPSASKSASHFNEDGEEVSDSCPVEAKWATGEGNLFRASRRPARARPIARLVRPPLDRRLAAALGGDAEAVDDEEAVGGHAVARYTPRIHLENDDGLVHCPQSSAPPLLGRATITLHQGVIITVLRKRSLLL